MIAITCRRCGSVNLRKNGRTARHHAVGKKTGETAHIERFNNTLRQRCANLVRKTLSFSKDEHWHEIRIRIFIDHYNRELERGGCLASVYMRPLP